MERIFFDIVFMLSPRSLVIILSLVITLMFFEAGGSSFSHRCEFESFIRVIFERPKSRRAKKHISSATSCFLHTEALEY
jgi:hypothetical protein